MLNNNVVIARYENAEAISEIYDEILRSIRPQNDKKGMNGKDTISHRL